MGADLQVPRPDRRLHPARAWTRPSAAQQYACDITYGTNNEFGFDYLRDNMAVRPEHRVQRGFVYAIVDEVDSVLIDEARTPLIISGPVAHSDQAFDELKPLVERAGAGADAAGCNADAGRGRGAARQDPSKEYEAGDRAAAGPARRAQAQALHEAALRAAGAQEAHHQRRARLHARQAHARARRGRCSSRSTRRRKNVDLLEKGRDADVAAATPTSFVLPDLAGAALASSRAATDLTPEQKIEERDALYRAYARQERAHPQHPAAAQGLLAVREGRRVRRAGRQGPDRRRVHRPPDAGPPLLRRPAPGDRGQGGRARRGRDPDAGHDHAPELLPHVREAGRHDRHGRDRGARVLRDLQARRRGDPDQPAGARASTTTTSSTAPSARSTTPSSTRSPSCHETRPAGAGRHDLGRGQRAAVAHAQAPRHHAQRAERQVPPAGGRDRRRAPASAARSPSPPTWPAAAPTSSSAPGVADLGGLHILGTERHESRRIDRQLRGRSGRQGDPGSSRFFLSLEDDLMRLFGTDRIAGHHGAHGRQEGEVIEHPLVTRAIERAQKRVEAHNFDIRKHLLEYDDVMNKQRKVVYDLRNKALPRPGHQRAGARARSRRRSRARVDKATGGEPGAPRRVEPAGPGRRAVVPAHDAGRTPAELETDRADDAGSSRPWRSARARLPRRARREFGAADDARARAPPLPVHARRALARPPLRARPPEGRHRPAGLRPARSAASSTRRRRSRCSRRCCDEVREDFVQRLFRVQLGARGARRSCAQPRAAAHDRGRSTPRRRRFGSRRRGAPRRGRPRPARRGAAGAGGARRPRAPVRAGAARSGRNDPCPCGSGKKYKKCHMLIDEGGRSLSDERLGRTRAPACCALLAEHLEALRRRRRRWRSRRWARRCEEADAHGRRPAGRDLVLRALDASPARRAGGADLPDGAPAGRRRSAC